MTKLPVWATVREAYGTVWQHRWALLRFAAVPFVLLLAVDLASAWLDGASPQVDDPDAWPWPSIAVDKAVSLLCDLIVIAFVVPCYRLLLLGVAGNRHDSWPARRVYLGMVALTLILAALIEVPITLDDYMLGTLGERTWPVVVLLGFAIVFLVSVRLAFLYPAICLGERWQLSKRWRHTAGNLWRLSAAFLLALLPLLLAMLLWAASFLIWWGEASDYVRATSLLEAVLETLLVFAGEALWAAVTAVAFAVLTGYPAKGVRVPSAPS